MTGVGVALVANAQASGLGSTVLVAGLVALAVLLAAATQPPPPMGGAQ